MVLGFDGQRPLGELPPELDVVSYVERVVDGEGVERLPDDREERCPLSRARILTEYLAGKARPPKTPPRLEYLQSLKLDALSGWLYRINRGRNEVYAVIIDRHGDWSIEWVS